MSNLTQEEFSMRIKILFGLIIFIISFGTIGFIILGKSFSGALMLTFQSLAFMFEEEEGIAKILEIFLAIFGVMTFAWVFTNIFEMFSSGNFREYLKIRDSFNKMKSMKKHYIIAGGGRVGEELATKLQDQGKKYIIIEKNLEAVSKLKKKDFLVMLGDVTDEEILKKAKLSEAKMLILALPETEKNLLVTLTAKEINPEIEIIARADKPSLVSKLKKAGARTVIVPELEAADRIFSSLE
ncbi:MAG: NAD-binding protein [Candidatus Pacearchaeota archaeon]|nr:NAD-binding protein [Candidatus Pacearchaeota archaeon]